MPSSGIPEDSANHGLLLDHLRRCGYDAAALFTVADADADDKESYESAPSKGLVAAFKAVIAHARAAHAAASTSRAAPRAPSEYVGARLAATTTAHPVPLSGRAVKAEHPAVATVLAKYMKSSGLLDRFQQKVTATSTGGTRQDNGHNAALDR